MARWIMGLALIATLIFGGAASAAGDGGWPTTLIAYEGALYGVTAEGGANSGGTVFQVTPDGIETVLYAFKGGVDGRFPNALTQIGGSFYGTTTFGGGDGCPYLKNRNGCGTVFAVTPAGVETILHSFGDGTEGSKPAGLTDFGGKLYGVTQHGDVSLCNSRYAKGCGTLYRLTLDGHYSLLHAFQGGADGAEPNGGLTALGGGLYGGTTTGGVGYWCGIRRLLGCGVVFEFMPPGEWRVVYPFGGGVDGAYAAGGLTRVDGSLYGVTYSGGRHGRGCSREGCGTVFKVSPAGVKTTLHIFKYQTEGAQPVGGLYLLGGDLYGVTELGGSASCECGAVFKMSRTGHLTVLYRFQGGTDGSLPAAPLTYLNGSLYGTTFEGGSNCALYQQTCGTVFSITPAGVYKQIYAFKGP